MCVGGPRGTKRLFFNKSRYTRVRTSVHGTPDIDSGPGQLQRAESVGQRSVQGADAGAGGPPPTARPSGRGGQVAAPPPGRRRRCSASSNSAVAARYASVRATACSSVRRAKSGFREHRVLGLPGADNRAVRRQGALLSHCPIQSLSHEPQVRAAIVGAPEENVITGPARRPAGESWPGFRVGSACQQVPGLRATPPHREAGPRASIPDRGCHRVTLTTPVPLGPGRRRTARPRRAGARRSCPRLGARSGGRSSRPFLPGSISLAAWEITKKLPGGTAASSLATIYRAWSRSGM